MEFSDLVEWVIVFLQLLVAYSKGTGQTDHKVVIQEVSSERIVQELKVIKVIWISKERDYSK